jgi:hypothetical protein
MNTALSVHRARTVNRPLIGLVAAHLAVILPAVLLIPIFAARLPADAVKVESYSIVTDIVFVGIFLLRIALRSGDRAIYAVETVLPLTLGYAGTGFFVIAGTVLINLDARTYQMVFQVPAGLAFTAFGLFLSFGVGRYLGSVASIRRLRREAASSRRMAWLTEVNADRSWRLAFGMVVGILYAILIVLCVLLPPGFPAVAALPAATLAAFVLAVQQASVFITDAGIRVSGRWLLGAPSWSLALAQVASAQAITAGPRTMLLSTNPGLCILRSGPALEVTSTTGRSYVVSLPEAQEAVSVLDRLMEHRDRGEVAPGVGTD